MMALNIDTLLILVASLALISILITMCVILNEKFDSEDELEAIEKQIHEQENYNNDLYYGEDK